MGKPTLIFIVFLLLVTLGALAYIKNPRPYKIAWASAIKGNIEHYLPCENLPFYTQVEKALQQHSDIADKIKNINGVASVQPEQVKCYMADNSNYFVKGDIVAEYSSRQAGKEIKKMIGDNFFGIPYRGINR